MNKIKSIVIKYRWSIIWFAIITFLIFLFGPAQEKYYLRSDLEKFKKVALNSKIVLGIILVLLLIFFNRHEMKNFRQGLVGIFLLSFFVAWSIFIFSYILDTGFLFANRIIPVNKINREFVATHLAGDTTDKLVDLIENGKEKDIIWDGPIIDQIKSMNFKSGEKFQIPFAKGIFGVYYLNGEPTRRN